MASSVRNAMWGGGGVKFPGKKCYEGVRFNVISITYEGVGRVKFPDKKRTLRRATRMTPLMSAKLLWC